MVRNQVAHQGDILYRIEALERKLEERTSGRKLTSSSIGNGGLRIIDNGFLEVDGGELRLLAENGVTVARWGDTYYGDWSRGWEFFYPSGQRAFIMGGTAANPAIVTYDVAGNVVFATDATSRNGVARPYVNYHLAPAWGTESGEPAGAPLWPATTDTTYKLVYEGTNSVWHPRVRYRFSTTTTGGGSAQWRLLCNDTQIASGTGAGWSTASIPGWGSDINPGDEVDFKVELRCAGGATRAAINYRALYGRQS